MPIAMPSNVERAYQALYLTGPALRFSETSRSLQPARQVKAAVRLLNDRATMFADAEYTPSMEQIDAVLAFLPTFEREDFVPSKVEAPPGLFPYHVFAEELNQFHQVVYDNGFVFSFDWPSWQKEAHRYYEQPELLLAADIQVLRKLITLHVRKERYCEGHLPVMVKCGHITAVLRRLKELREASDCSHGGKASKA